MLRPEEAAWIFLTPQSFWKAQVIKYISVEPCCSYLAPSTNQRSLFAGKSLLSYAHLFFFCFCSITLCFCPSVTVSLSQSRSMSLSRCHSLCLSLVTVSSTKLRLMPQYQQQNRQKHWGAVSKLLAQ